MAYRLRRRRRSPSLSVWIRGRMVGFLYLALAPIVAGAITYLTSVIPNSYIVIDGSSITVTNAPPATDAILLGTNLIIGLLGWAFSIFLFISGYRRLTGNRV